MNISKIQILYRYLLQQSIFIIIFFFNYEEHARFTYIIFLLTVKLILMYEYNLVN